MPALIPDQLLTALAAFPSARRYWVAYSGGRDSAVLLHALAEVRERLPGELRAAHVDHGLLPFISWRVKGKACPRPGLCVAQGP